MVDLSVEFAGLKLQNPTTLASGILGLTYGNLLRAKSGGAGALTTKSSSLLPRPGHRNPILIESDGCFLNAVGLSNPGADALCELLAESKKLGVPVIASVFGRNGGEFAELAKKAEKTGASAVELNVSCPNVSENEGVGEIIGKNPKLVADITRAVKSKVGIPVIVKLTPNVSDITAIGMAAEEAGADALCAINTLGPGMRINLEAKRPVLSNKFGGVSGPAVKPIAVASVYKLYEAVRIPILGVGGVTTGRDAVEMVMAGAGAVGVGTGVFYRGFDVFSKITGELSAFMKKRDYSTIDEMVGVAHGK